MRAASMAKTPRAMLSRAVCGVLGGTLVVNLPGSPRAAKENLAVLVPVIPHAVEKIRGILGPTDPSKAQPGSVRREFGRDVMVNAAHASDSPENAARELKIIKPEEDIISVIVNRYYG